MLNSGLDGATASPNAGAGSRRVLAAATLALAALLAAYALAHPGAGPSGLSAPAAHVPAAIPASSSAVSRLLGADEPAFWASRTRGGAAHRNARQHLSVRYASGGVRVAVHGGTATMALSDLGRAGHLRAAPSATPATRANRVTYARGAGVSEWYANGPLGIEQGLTLKQRPAGGAPLAFRFALGGSLAPRLAHGVMSFGRPGAAAPLISYRGLSATDATGRALPARLALSGHTLTIRVADAGARYPIVVDPTVQNAQLTGSDSIKGDRFGSAVAQSAAGDLVVIGAPQAKLGNNYGQGAVYVFVKPSKGWANATQTSKLTAPDAAAGDGFGTAVAVVGATVVVGAPYKQVGQAYSFGAVYAFAKPSGGWGKPAASVRLYPTAAAGGGGTFGAALASSGSQLFVGAPGGGGSSGSSGPGAVFEYTQPAGGWRANTPQTAILASTETGYPRFGTALAADGNTVVVGAPFAPAGTTTYAGDAYVFTMPAGGWRNSSAGAKLTASDAGQDDALGTSVSIFADTGTIALGAPGKKVGANQQAGGVYVYQEPKGGWRTGTQTAEETQSGSPEGTGIGHTVAITNPKGTGEPTPPGAKAADNSPPTVTGWKISVVGGSSNGSGLTSWGSATSGWVNQGNGTLVNLPVFGSAASAYSLSLGAAGAVAGVDSNAGTVLVIPGSTVKIHCLTVHRRSLALAHAAIYRNYCGYEGISTNVPTSSYLATAATWVFGTIAVVSGGISVVAAETTKDSAALIQPEVAAPAFVVAVGAGIIAYGAHVINEDPPDKHYRTLVKLKIAKAHHYHAGHPFGRSLTRRLQRFAKDQAKLKALVGAASTSINRAGTALTKKSTKWQGAQTRAALSFFKRAYPLLAKVIKETPPIGRALRHVKPYSATMKKLRALGRSVKRHHGFSKSVVRHLRKFGFSTAKIKRTAKLVMAVNSTKGAKSAGGTLGHVLFAYSVKLDKELQALIKMYRTYPPVLAAAKLR